MSEMLTHVSQPRDHRAHSANIDTTSYAANTRNSEIKTN